MSRFITLLWFMLAPLVAVAQELPVSRCDALDSVVPGSWAEYLVKSSDGAEVWLRYTVLEREGDLVRFRVTRREDDVLSEDTVVEAFRPSRLLPPAMDPEFQGMIEVEQAGRRFRCRLFESRDDAGAIRSCLAEGFPFNYGVIVEETDEWRLELVATELSFDAGRLPIIPAPPAGPEVAHIDWEAQRQAMTGAPLGCRAVYLAAGGTRVEMIVLERIGSGVSYSLAREFMGERWALGTRLLSYPEPTTGPWPPEALGPDGTAPAVTIRFPVTLEAAGHALDTYVVEAGGSRWWIAPAVPFLHGLVRWEQRGRVLLELESSTPWDE